MDGVWSKVEMKIGLRCTLTQYFYGVSPEVLTNMAHAGRSDLNFEMNDEWSFSDTFQHGKCHQSLSI